MTDTPNGVEILDVYDEAGKHTGSAPRDEVHEQGLWHPVFHCLVVADRSGTPTAVLQLRSSDKAAFPGLLDVSSAGHLGAGETPIEGLRELDEELGIAADPDALVELGMRRLVDDSGEGRLNRELVHVFLLRDDRPLTEYRTQPEEVDGVFNVSIAELLDLLHDETHSMRVAGVLDAGHDTARTDERTITREDLVPSDGYWTVLMVMAERFMAGNTSLAI